MKKKKSFRDIRNAVVMLCIMLAMLSTATFAWFSMNDRVSATGMQVQAKSEGSLLINKDAVVPKGHTVTDVDFEDADATKLIPVTYKESEGWQIVENGAGVDMTTGSPGAATTDVNMVKNTHYVEYLVFIASSGETMTGKTLKATVTANNTDTLTAANAITVAFYVGDAAPAASAEPSEVVRVNAGETAIDTVEIPSCMNAAAGLPITMRVYFDGAASGDGTKAYINSKEVPTEGSIVTVEFKAN